MATTFKAFMSLHRFTVLILCTGNSCRSIMAEAILKTMVGDRWQVYSAGSHPKGTLDAKALMILSQHGISTQGLSSKSWDLFSNTRVDLLSSQTKCNTMIRCCAYGKNLSTAHA
ncbi:MAG: hypothetical protein K2Q12_00685, partial [Rickettsiales bacterium]|nr:hypothetical protein [Rickettsiales bacterium]